MVASHSTLILLLLARFLNFWTDNSWADSAIDIIIIVCLIFLLGITAATLLNNISNAATTPLAPMVFGPYTAETLGFALLRTERLLLRIHLLINTIFIVFLIELGQGSGDIIFLVQGASLS